MKKWPLFIAFIVCFCHGSWVFAQGNSVTDVSVAAADHTVELTEEELEWIKNNPVIRATNKTDTAPNEFLRAGEPAGFSVDYLNLVAESVGLQIEYIHGYSWGELLDKLEKREIDISHNIFMNEERARYLNFTEPYLNLEPAFFGRKETGPVETADDLKGKKIGVVKGWALNNEYKQKYPELIFVEFENSLNAVLSLSKGDIDVHIATLFIGESLIDKYFINNLEVVGRPDFLEITNNEGARLAVRNDWPILYSILQKGMDRISEQQYRDLSEKWLIPQNSGGEIGLTSDEMSWLRQNPVIKVVVDKSMLPIESIDDKGNIHGVVGDYLDIFSDKLDVQFEWVENIAFSDGMDMIDAGEADMITALSDAGDRREYLTFTDTYMIIDSVIFGREGEDIFGDMSGLAGRSIAMPREWDITGWIRRDYPDINIVEVANKTEALHLVSQGGADAHVGSIPTTSHNIQSEKITNMVVAGVTPYQTEIRMGIRSDLNYLASAMQKAMASVPPEERYQISQRWLGLEAEIRPDYTLALWILGGSAVVIALAFAWVYRLGREVRERKASEARFRQIAETVDGVFFICSPDLKQTRYISPDFEEWTNVSCDDFCNNPEQWLDFIHPEDLALFKQSLTRAVESRFVMRVPDYRIIDFRGEIRWLSTQAHPVSNDEGEIVSVVGFITDITGRIRAREKLDEISNQFQNAFTHASHGMALVSLDGRFLRVNDALCQTLGYTNAELTKLTANDITHPEDMDLGDAVVEELTTGRRQSFQLEKRHIKKDGTSVPVQLNVSIVFDKDGKPDHFVAQIQDLSELKEREEQLRHSQKMDAVGELTGGIAHDFNNILAIILGHLQIVQKTELDDPKVTDRIEKALKGVKRGSSLIDKLLSFSSRKPRPAVDMVINDSLVAMVEVITSTFKASVKVVTEFSDDLWPITVDEGDLENAILNLALNARDAMQEDGTLTIKTENVVLDTEYVLKNPGSSVGKNVMISVGDTGAGIEARLMDKILEPFFTTKAPDKGTGMGLSMVHGFVQRAGGHMKIDTKLNEGTTFRIYIPAVEEVSTEPVPNVNDNARLPTGTETILVVDDEKHLCEIAETQLKNLGYQVFSANNGPKALEIIREHKDIDLLFSDVVMPDNLDGYKMAGMALDLRPSLKILLTSGYSQDIEDDIPEEDKVLASLAENMLHKPYNQYDLAVAVRKSLDG